MISPIHKIRLKKLPINTILINIEFLKDITYLIKFLALYKVSCSTEEAIRFDSKLLI